MTEWDKSVTELAAQQGAGGFLGMKLSRRPGSFAELQELVKAENSGFFTGFDEVIELIGSSANPDAIVRQLPYDEAEGTIAFILPAEEQAR